jgi:cobalt-zinc-cadmium resistance protein CzcA
VPLRPRKEWPAAAKEVKVNGDVVAAWRSTGLPKDVVEKLKNELQDKKILVEKMKTAEGDTVVSHRLEEEMSKLLSLEDYKRWREPIVKATADEADKHVSYLTKIFPTIWPDWRPRTKEELIASMNSDFHRSVPGVVWNFSQNIKDNVMESLSGFKGDNSLKIFGPDFEKLEVLANKVKDRMQEVPGMVDVGVIHEMGQSHLQFRVDPEKCERYGTCTADVNNVVSSALGARALTEMVEGEKQFDIAIRWPLRLRNSEVAILDIPLDLYNNTVVQPQGGSNPIPNSAGITLAPPSKIGTLADTTNQLSANAPRVTLRDVISPVTPDGSPDARFKITDKTVQTLAEVNVPEKVLAKLRPMKDQGFDTRDTFVFAVSNVLDKEEMKLYQEPIVARATSDAQFVRAGAAAIFREQGKRLIAIKFGVRGRDLGSTVSDAKERIKDLIKPPYRTEWAGEIEQMEDAQGRLLWIVPISLGLIFILLYLAFHSFLDAIVIFSNVFDVAVGGIWALYLTGTTFSVSAAVGFISLFGIAIMEGLLMISYFNALRAEGLKLNDAIIQGASKRVRPVMITALTAILGLLPAALSDKIGAQTSRPLAIVVVGGMILTLFVDRYLMPVLYTFYGNRTPPAGSGSMAH